MSSHLSPAMLNGLADGELSVEQLAASQLHLESCATCTSKALTQTLLKRAVAKSAHRYEAPEDLAERLKRRLTAPVVESAGPALRWTNWAPAAGWAAAAILLLASIFFLPRDVRNFRAGSLETGALVTEVCDLHIATLAGGLPPEVVSTDRHTVKPWFQGKLPFSFNLPLNLPADVTLEGANLTYLQGKPVAQVMYSIGRHRASVFLGQTTGANMPLRTGAEHSGFHVAALSTNDLQVVAVSDVDPTRLADLVSIVEHAQNAERK